MTAGVHSGVVWRVGGWGVEGLQPPLVKLHLLPLRHQLYFNKPLHGCQEERVWQTRRGLPHKTSKASDAAKTLAGERRD